MKLDDDFSFIRVCPETLEQLTPQEFVDTDGICAKCGHVNNSQSFTHERRISGKWLRPVWHEKMRGKKPVFLNRQELQNYNA